MKQITQDDLIILTYPCRNIGIYLLVQYSGLLKSNKLDETLLRDVTRMMLYTKDIFH